MNAIVEVLPTLYIRDSKGKERQWSVRTDGAKIIVEHGLVEGKKTEKVTTAKAKNIGKVNETTPEQQALLEAQSKWTFQVNREDYHEDIERAGLQLRPMLALDYTKVPHRVNWDEAVGQPKLDGLRLTVGNRFAICHESREYRTYDPAEPFEMLTRKGETYSVPHLIEPCAKLLERVNEIVDGRCLALDGEAYIHGMPLQKIVSRAKKYQEGITEELEFHLFDLIIPGMGFAERHTVLVEALMSIEPTDTLQIVHYVELNDEDHLKDWHGKWTELGYEGAMIRHAGSEYGIAQRSAHLFKFKEFYDDEFRIVDVWEDNNGNAMFTVEIKTGQKLTCNDHVATVPAEFGCTPKRTHVERKEMLKTPEEFIGKWITVKYQDLTIDNIPSFPVGLAIRDCDEDGNPVH